MTQQTIVDLAAELGVSKPAIRKWLERGAVPHRWRLPILSLARKRRKRLAAGAFVGLKFVRVRGATP